MDRPFLFSFSFQEEVEEEGGRSGKKGRR